MIEIATQMPFSLAEVMATIDDHQLSAGAIETGFGMLDQALGGGLHPGNVTLVGGGPGVGKTIATLQMARNMAMRGIPVAYLCYEHGERALLARLLLLELGDMDVARRDVMASSEAIWKVAHGEQSWATVASQHLVLRAAQARVTSYGDNLAILQGSASFDLDAIAGLVDDTRAATLFVDYLQKIPSTHGSSDDRVMAAGEGLKELALRAAIAVVAVVAGNEAGLQERRLRLHHLRGAEALAYEADVVIMLNAKSAAVSRRHSAFDSVKAREFSRWVVFSIEKNRHGPAEIDMEFAKDFTTYRFVTDGRFVEERLIDGTVESD